jgi:hypothetical protein
LNGLLRFDEADVEAAEAILEAAVEEERVAAETPDGRTVPDLTRLYRRENDDVSEVRGEHVGFITGLIAVEKQRPPSRCNSPGESCHFGRLPSRQRAQSGRACLVRRERMATRGQLAGCGRSLHAPGSRCKR